jgi:hypothetical protein
MLLVLTKADGRVAGANAAAGAKASMGDQPP